MVLHGRILGTCVVRVALGVLVVAAYLGMWSRSQGFQANPESRATEGEPRSAVVVIKPLLADGAAELAHLLNMTGVSIEFRSSVVPTFGRLTLEKWEAGERSETRELGYVVVSEKDTAVRANIAAVRNVTEFRIIN